MTPLYTTAPSQRSRRPARVLLVAALVTVIVARTAAITHLTRSGRAHPPAGPAPTPTAWRGTPAAGRSWPPRIALLCLLHRRASGVCCGLEGYDNRSRI